MERMWRKVNHSFTGRNSKSTSTIQSTDTASSAGGFGDGQIVVAVAGISSASGYLASNNNILPSSTATGRRLAASGQMPIPISGGSSGNAQQKSLSQHVLLGSTASSERRRRRRRKSRARRSACVGGGADNMSSSGGFYSKDSTNKRHHHQQPQHQQQHQHQQYSSNGLTTMASTSAPSGTVMMYPNIDVTTISGDGGRVGSFDVGAGGGNSGNVTAIREGTSISVATTIAAAAAAAAAAEAVATTAQPDISLRQRAVAKLRMFNFHLNWDLHMTHCKPCGPRIGSGGSGGGNIITRRLCRNRRREDNELYRSNSFKFERFERKEYIEELSDTLQKKIAICDDYSLPIDFVKKRPSSFDPCLAETIPNPETWTAPSPLSDFVAFADQQQQQNQQGPIPPPSVAASTSASACPTIILSAAPSTQQQPQQQQQHQFQFPLHHHHTSLHQHQKQNQQQQQQQQQKSHHYSLHHKNPKLQRSHHPPLPHPTIKQASVKIVEGYSDPKDSKRPKKVYHKKSKRRRSHHVNTAISNTSRRNNINNNNNNSNSNNNNSHCEPASSRDKRSNYSSDSSAPKSSDDDDDNDNDEDNQSIKVPELNSPDSISEDLVRPLPIQLHRSPRKLTTGNGGLPENSKRNPSPYYYSDLLKPKDALGVTTATDKETKNKSRQSTSSEPPQLTQPQVVPEVYRKSTSLDVPEQRAGEDSFDNHGAESEVFDETPPQPAPAQATLPQPALSPQSHHTKDITPKRYSFTEDGVRIIRCTTPSTSTSDDSDCSECQKRREWHARALALVRKTCNIVVPADYCDGGGCEDDTAPIISSTKHNNPGDELRFLPFDSETSSMPPHRLLGPAVCACVAPTIGDDLDEYFKPRSIFYVHPQGVHECSDCSPNLKVAAEKASRKKNSNNKKNEEGQKDEGGNEDDEDDNDDDEEDDDMSSGRTRQIYETAFDCKIAKSDDDLDEVDRIENHSVLLQLNNGNNVVLPPTKTDHNRSSSRTRESSGCGGKSRMEGKRLKNSKNQALQEKATTTTTTGSAVSEAVTTTTTKTTTAPSTIGTTNTADPITGALSAELENSHIHNDDGVDQMNNATSSSQLPMRGYTPSPPSTAPLPIKFPAKHDRFFMNSIKSAPNLPSSNSVHPRLKDLRLPIQSSLRLHQQQQQQNQQQQYPGSSSLLGGSNDNSLADSGLYPPPSMKVPSSSSSSAHHHHYPLSHHIKATATSSATSKTRDRPRSFVLEAGRVLELRKSHHSSSHHHHNHHHHVANGTGGGGGGSNVPGRRQQNYSSTESIATSSSGGSMESLRSSTSEGNRSTSSSESRHSTSLSSHSSESGSSSVAFPLRAPIVLHSKLHILSPISDKSSQEPASDASELNKTQNVSPEDAHQQQQQHQLESNQLKVAGEVHSTNQTTGLDGLKKRRPPTNKTLLHLADEILGSDSGISLHSREDGKPTSGIHRFTLPKLNFSPSDKLANNENGACGGAGGGTTGNSALPQDLHELPFDMPKLRRRKTMQQDACTSGSATSVDLGDLPFDMPKLRRRLRMNQTEISNLMVQSTESSGISQASSSHSMRDDNKVSIKLDNTAIFRQNLTLNLNEPRPTNKFGSLDLRGTASNKELNLNLNTGIASAVDLIDITIPLERQGWYHGAITRIEAETTLRPLSEGSFLVRNCESTKQDFSLSLKGAKGFMHMRIQRNDSGQYILGQFSRPFDSVPEMIRHFCLNRLPVRGAEHMCLIDPVIAQLL